MVNEMSELKERPKPNLKDFVQIGTDFNVVLKTSAKGNDFLSIGQKNKNLSGQQVWNNVLVFDKDTAALLYDTLGRLGPFLPEDSRKGRKASSSASVPVESVE